MSTIRNWVRDFKKLATNPRLLKARVTSAVNYIIKKNKLKFVQAEVDEDVAAVIEEVRDYTLAEYSEFNKVIGITEKVAGEAGKKYATHLRGIDWKSHPSIKGKAPPIVFGPTPSKGFYDPRTHTIQIDLDKHDNDLALLDTLLYESINAVRTAECNEAMVKFNEYGTDLVYIDKLKNIYGVNLSELCIKLGVSKYMIKPDEDTCVKQKLVPMPTRAEVSMQSARQALWFWKTEGWSEANKKMLYGASLHAPGMKSTTEVYKADQPRVWI